MARITIDNIAHSYVKQPSTQSDFVLKHINCRWKDGGAYALLGPSGCGKTTLLNIISGLITPSHGRILFNDDDVTLRPTAERNIAQVFQFPVIYDTMTVRENLAFPLINRHVPKQEVNRLVEGMLDMLELRDKANRRARGLTADEKQKVSLGRGLVRENVSAILFDEPLTVIDPHLKRHLREKLRQRNRQLGHTMIYVTHDQNEALSFADEAVVMYEGEIVQSGTPLELYEKPEHTFVGHFIGSPGMNFFPANIEQNAAFIDGIQLNLLKDYHGINGQDVELGVRPEFVSLVDAAKASGNSLPMQVHSVHDVGRMKIVRGDIAGHPLHVVIDEDDVPPGDVAAVFDMTKVNLYRDSRLVVR